MINFDEMTALYNMCDCVVNRSSNEGFGLPTLEAMMCGKPIIVIKTGGLTRQVENQTTGEQYGIAIEPEVKVLAGNQTVPFIYEDFISHKTLADAFMKMYELGQTKREEIGLRAAARARVEYNLEDIVSEWDRTLSSTIASWEDPTTDKNTWKVTEL
jgi:glycosyltransferase involved in cell wall biosynthesis